MMCKCESNLVCAYGDTAPTDGDGDGCTTCLGGLFLRLGREDGFLIATVQELPLATLAIRVAVPGEADALPSGLIAQPPV